MKVSAGVEWAVHCCVVLTGVTQPVPATRLAELHELPPSYLAKQLQALARAGLVRSVQGNSGGYLLTRAPDRITVLDVVQAIEGDRPLFACTEIRQRGPLGTPPEDCRTACPVHRAMQAAERAWRAVLGEITVADLAHQANEGAGRDVLGPIRSWLADERADTTAAVEPAE